MHLLRGETCAYIHQKWKKKTKPNKKQGIFSSLQSKETLEKMLTSVCLRVVLNYHECEIDNQEMISNEETYHVWISKTWAWRHYLGVVFSFELPRPSILVAEQEFLPEGTDAACVRRSFFVSQDIHLKCWKILFTSHSLVF